MKAIAANTTTVPARVAAPSPIAENATLARKIAGMAASTGSHESRHAGIRRNASARSSNAANVAAAVKPDSILCAVRMPGVVGAGRVDPLAVEPEDPVEEGAHSRCDQGRGAKAAEEVGAQCAPEPDAERDDQEPGDVGGELVVEPGLLAVRAPRSERSSLAGLNAAR